MAKCSWCSKFSDKLISYSDAIGNSYNICTSCKTRVDSCICRKCGKTDDPMLIIKGLCSKCIQVEMHEKNKKREETMMGVNRDMLHMITSDVEFTEEDYERWVTMGNTFSPDDMSNKELRRIWIMVKFNAAGIYDNDIILKNFEDIEKLLDRNFSKLVNNKCRILIGNTSEARKIVANSTVIDYEREAYILQA